MLYNLIFYEVAQYVLFYSYMLSKLDVIEILVHVHEMK